MTNLLPTNYIEAKRTIAECARVDECKEWADKAAALKSYAKQSRDVSLYNDAQRIQDRAIRRAGELLDALERERGMHKNKKGSDSLSILRKATEEAGLSDDQARQMMRVARIPADQFEAAVERDKPATVNKLAAMGTDKRERLKPEPYRNEWIDWTNAVNHLASLPACGLDVLAVRLPDMTNDLLTECRAALPNLQLWLRLLEKQYGRQKTEVHNNTR
jgi:hypothetical protein